MDLNDQHRPATADSNRCRPDDKGGNVSSRLVCDIRSARANGGGRAKRSLTALRSDRPVYSGTSRSPININARDISFCKQQRRLPRAVKRSFRPISDVRNVHSGAE